MSNLNVIPVVPLLGADEQGQPNPPAGQVSAWLREDGTLVRLLPDGTLKIEGDGSGGSGSPDGPVQLKPVKEGQLLVSVVVQEVVQWMLLDRPSGTGTYFLTADKDGVGWKEAPAAQPTQPTQPTNPTPTTGTAAKLTGTYSASSSFGNGYGSELIYDGDSTTRGLTAGDQFPAWVMLDLGAGVSAKLTKVRVLPTSGEGTDRANNLQVQTSVDGSTWTDLGITGTTAQNSVWMESNFSAAPAGRYVRIFRQSGEVIDLYEAEFWG